MHYMYGYGQKDKTSLQEMHEVQYPGQKWGLDLCGPYLKAVSGARYILTAVDLYSGWPEVWALADEDGKYSAVDTG